MVKGFRVPHCLNGRKDDVCLLARCEVPLQGLWQEGREQRPVTPSAPMVPLGWAAKRSPGGAADSAHRKAGSSGRSSRTGEDEEGSQAWDAGPPENLVSRRAAAVLRHQRVPAQPQREPSHQGHAHLFISGSLCMHKAPVDVLEQSPIQGELITLIWALTKPYHCKRLTGSCRCPLWVGSDILPKGWGKHRRTNQSAAFASQTIPRSAVREQDEVDKEILGAGGGHPWSQ